MAAGVSSLRPTTVAAALLVAVGATARVLAYADNPSLWLDESLLALNVLPRSYADLGERLDFVQGAPLGFLTVSKLATDAFGTSEYALRLVPLVASLSALPVFFAVARRVLPPRAALAALAIFALAEPLIFQAANFKQYSLDVLVCLLLLAGALALERRPLTGRLAVACALAGALAMWFSHAAVFVLAAVGAALAVAELSRGGMRRLAYSLPVAAVWLVSFAALYAVNLRHLDGVREANRASAGATPGRYLALPPSSAEELRRLVGDLSAPFTGHLGLPLALAVAAGTLALVGVAVLVVRRRTLLAFLVLPAVLTAAASGAEVYPWGDRFVLFLVPSVVVLILLGAVELARRGAALPVARLATAAGLVALVAAPAVAASKAMLSPAELEGVRPVLAELRAHWRPGDTLYVDRNAQFAFRYYAEYRGFNSAPGADGSLWPLTATSGRSATAAALLSRPPTLIVGRGDEQRAHRYRDDIPALVGRTRVFLLSTHAPAEQRDSRLLARLTATGEVHEVAAHHGARAYLYRADAQARARLLRTASQR